MEYLWPAVSNYYRQPLAVDRGEMQYVWDLEGRKYLDFFGGILTISVGHCNPKVTIKIKAQVDRLQHTSTLYPNEQIVDLAEKVAQMQNEAPAIPRLHVAEYDWWNESLHGVARSGYATVFPQAIGLAATWDPHLIERGFGVRLDQPKRSAPCR